MIDIDQIEDEVNVPGLPEAFSKCGCLRGELKDGIITITKVNPACNHNIQTTHIPKGAAKDVASILKSLGS